MEYFNKTDLQIKLNNWLINLMDEELSANTLKRYRINVSSLIDFIDNKPIIKRTILEYKDYLLSDKKYLISTANNYLIITNKFLKYLKLDELQVKIYRVQRRDSIDEYISYTDYHRLLRCSLKHGDIQTHLIIRILAETGIRVEELKYFQVENLNRTIEVKNKGKIRNIVIHQSLLVTIRKYIKNNHIYRGYIFSGRNNKPLHSSTIRKRLKKVAGYSRIKLEKVHPHSFRHYFATRYLEQHPDDILTLSDLMGHSSLETTRIYTRLSNKQKGEILKNVKF